MNEIKTYCPECEEYTGEVVDTSIKEGVVEQGHLEGITYEENTACCKCSVCGYEWEFVLTIKPIR